MDKTLKQEKIKLWKKQEEVLEKELGETMKKKGAAAQLGDLSENADYKMYIEQSEMISARMALIQKMIKDLEKAV